MAKKKTKAASKPRATRGTTAQPNLFRRYLARRPNALPLAILLVLLLIFFGEVMFGGKTFLPPDRLGSASFSPFVDGALSEGTYPLWNPYIFSGMPLFASLQRAPFVDLVGNVFHGIHWVLSKVFPISDFTRLFLNYVLLGVMMYVLLMRRTGARLVALFSALALIFQPQVISFAIFGHSTKATTAALIPIIFLMADELLKKRQVKYFALLALAVGLQLLRAHTQIAYYTFMMIGLLIIFWLVESLRNKESFRNIGKSLAMIVVAMALGVMVSSVLYLSVIEYSDYSIRGGSTGLDYGYATNWSFSPREMTTFLVPSFMGFGGQTYWGGMPATDYPLYLGIITLLMAGLAPVLRRDRYVIFFLIVAALSLVISFGKTLPVLYTPLFEFLPFFNRFRVPLMIHILLAFAVTFLAGVGLHELLRLRDESKHDKVRKYVYAFAAVGGTFALFLLLAKSTYLGWVTGSGRQLPAAVLEAAYEKAAGDGLKLILFLALSGFGILYYLKGRIKSTTLGMALVALLVVDLWWVDFKFANPRPKADQTAFFAENEAVKFLKSRQDAEPFRIFAVYDSKPENWYMYYKIQDIRGHSTARLRIYEDFLASTALDARDRYGLRPFLKKYVKVVFNDGQPGLQLVPREQVPSASFQRDNAILDMLNVKYLVSEVQIPDPRYQQVSQGRPAVFENTGVLPRAYFVERTRVIKTKEGFFDYLNGGSLNPAKEAILEKEPPFEIQPGASQVQVTSYDLHEIELQAEVEQPALMVLSEVYYPAGWKAYVDGQETEIFKTNYILRSIFLQPGSHEIRFVFEPRMFRLGVWITFGTLFTLLALLVYSSAPRRTVLIELR